MAYIGNQPGTVFKAVLSLPQLPPRPRFQGLTITAKR